MADTRLKAYLENAAPYTTGAMYLIDASGALVTNNDETTTSSPP